MKYKRDCEKIRDDSDISADVHGGDIERTKKMTMRGEMMKKTKTNPLPGQDILFLRENITPPGTSGAVRRSVNMLRNGA
jgi:hypothetical protein